MSGKDELSDSDVRAAWNSGAQVWEESIESGMDSFRREVHGPALLGVCEPVRDLAVLDLGCGQGYFSRELARQGARVVGVDISEQLIAYARIHEKQYPLGIEYHAMSATEVNRHWKKESFELVAACMSLQDIADAGACLESVRDVLHRRGRMVFSIPHPCTDPQSREWELEEVDNRLQREGYFASGRRVCHWNTNQPARSFDTPYWRYTIGEWSEFIAKAGFLIRRLVEPRPSEEQVRQRPEFAESYRTPYFLLFDLVKP